jgi:hypothetical protein
MPVASAMPPAKKSGRKWFLNNFAVIGRLGFLSWIFRRIESCLEKASASL